MENCPILLSPLWFVTVHETGNVAEENESDIRHCNTENLVVLVTILRAILILYTSLEQ